MRREPRVRSVEGEVLPIRMGTRGGISEPWVLGWSQLPDCF